MKPSLSLGLRQQLRMTPQLQQAIRLLQLSALDLRLEIREALERNPMLEEMPEEEADGDTDNGKPGENEPQATADTFADRVGSEYTQAGDATPDDAEAFEIPDFAESAMEPPAVDAELTQPIPEELPVDSNWDDVFQPPALPVLAADSHRDIDDTNSAAETLDDHLLWQLNLTPMSDSDRLIATAIVDAVNTDGMLEAGIDDLLEEFRPGIGHRRRRSGRRPQAHTAFRPPRRRCEKPVGVPGTANSRRSTRKRPGVTRPLPSSPSISGCLAPGDFAALKRRTRLGEAELAAVAALIQTLNPRPGAALATGPAEYVVPDVVVRKEKHRWLVELNPEATPTLRINQGYASLVRRADSSRQNTWLKDNLAEARWFLKSLESRHETLLRVARKIVEIQRGFLGTRRRSHAPLGAARDRRCRRAARIDHFPGDPGQVHADSPGALRTENTSSRATSAPATAEEISSIAIRAMIRKLTACEKPQKTVERQQNRGNTGGTEHQGREAHRCQVSRVDVDSTVESAQASYRAMTRPGTNAATERGIDTCGQPAPGIPQGGIPCS